MPPISLCVSIRIPLSFARKLLGKKITAASNTHATIEEYLHASLSVLSILEALLMDGWSTGYITVIQLQRLLGLKISCLLSRHSRAIRPNELKEAQATAARIVGVSAEIRTAHLANICQKH
jgi:hypothetical protein